MLKIIFFIGIGIAVLALILVAITSIFGLRPRIAEIIPGLGGPTATPGQEATPTPGLGVTATPVTEISESWIVFTSRILGFSIKHPREVNVDPRGIKKVALVGENLELIFDEAELKGRSLREVADEEVAILREEGVAGVRDPEEIEIGGRNGYRIDTEGRNYTLIPKDDDWYLVVINEKPGGSEGVVNQMMSTLELIEEDVWVK